MSVPCRAHLGAHRLDIPGRTHCERLASRLQFDSAPAASAPRASRLAEVAFDDRSRPVVVTRSETKAARSARRSVGGNHAREPHAPRDAALPLAVKWPRAG